MLDRRVCTSTSTEWNWFYSVGRMDYPARASKNTPVTYLVAMAGSFGDQLMCATANQSNHQSKWGGQDMRFKFKLNAVRLTGGLVGTAEEA